MNRRNISECNWLVVNLTLSIEYTIICGTKLCHFSKKKRILKSGLVKLTF